MSRFSLLILCGDPRRLQRWAAASSRVWYTRVSRGTLSGVSQSERYIKIVAVQIHREAIQGRCTRCSPSFFLAFFFFPSLTTACALGCDSERLQRVSEVPSVCLLRQAGPPPHPPHASLAPDLCWLSQASDSDFPLWVAGSQWSAGSLLLATVFESGSQIFRVPVEGRCGRDPNAESYFCCRLVCIVSRSKD